MSDHISLCTNYFQVLHCMLEQGSSRQYVSIYTREEVLQFHLNFSGSAQLFHYLEAYTHFGEIAIRELSNGQKLTHFMWFIFPTPPHNGNVSRMNAFWALSDENTAAFLSCNMLRSTYIVLMNVVHDQLKRKIKAAVLMNGDQEKLLSNVLHFHYWGTKRGDSVLTQLCWNVMCLLETTLRY